LSEADEASSEGSADESLETAEEAEVSEEDDDDEELSSFISLPQEVQDTAINAAQKAAAINLLVTDIILTP